MTFRCLSGFISLVSGVYALILFTFLLLRFITRDSLWWVAFLGDFTIWYFVPLLVLFPIAVLGRARYGVLLMLPLVIVGALWYGRYYMPRANAQTEGAELSVITFNVWGANPRLDAVEAWLREMDADVVLLQEAPPSWVRGGLQQLTDLYPYQLNRAAEHNLWGHALLSKYPFQPAETADYQRVLLDLNGDTIAVYNVHMPLPMQEVPHLPLDTQHGFLNMMLRYDPERRNAVIRQLLNQLDAETYPYIVGGDFNMSDQSLLYDELAARMGDSFREAGQGFGASWPIAEIVGLPSFVPPLVRIDYLWHSREFQTVSARQGPDLNSDHLPLYAAFSLSPR